jgi:hypothetical protein
METLNPPPAIYCLRLEGRVSGDWSSWLQPCEVSYEGAVTVLTGGVADQSALFGLLSFISGLGISLISVQRIEG